MIEPRNPIEKGKQEEDLSPAPMPDLLSYISAPTVPTGISARKRLPDVEIEGTQVKVTLQQRDENDKHMTFSIHVEDDEAWFEKITLSTLWLDDLIDILKDARTELKRHYKKGDFGYEKRRDT